MKHMAAESLEYNNSLIDYKEYDAGFFKDIAAESHIRDLELILSVVDQLLHPKKVLHYCISGKKDASSREYTEHTLIIPVC